MSAGRSQVMEEGKTNASGTARGNSPMAFTSSTLAPGRDQRSGWAATRAHRRSIHPLA